LKEKFCKALSNNITFRVSNTGDNFSINPCCYYTGGETFSPEEYQKQRQKFVNSKTFLEGCVSCKSTELLSNKSYRSYNNREIPDVGDTLYKLDLILDTTCNAACIHCGPTQSSLWRKEIQKDKKIFHIQPEHNINNMVDQIKSTVDLDEIKHFHFWGGEPLLTDTHLKFLCDLKDKKNIELSYTTNCSIVPSSEIVNFWKQFKKITIYLSIDGIKETFNYIRWPLNWEKIESNLKLFKNINLDNLYYHFNYATIPLNVFYFDKFLQWKTDNFMNFNNKPVDYRLLPGHGTLNISNTPPMLRREVYRKFGFNHQLTQLLIKTPVTDCKKMIDYLDKWDLVRKSNWREIFKEIHPYFNTPINYK
jgi:hypothetical protein